MQSSADLPGTFPGHRYWKTIQGSVDAILAPMGIKRRVVSMGTRFVNYDAWTWLSFCDEICKHLAAHPDRSPTTAELKEILKQANEVSCRDPHIQVAKMPSRVTHRVALAIMGGGYHEAWHTKYSKRTKVRLEEAQPIVDLIDEVTLAGGKWDAKMRGLLTTLHHLVEDIRIERRGNEDFPGAMQPMRDLQDFILDLEAKGRAEGAKIKNITVSTNARSILLCAFRDLGLGYNTEKSRAALDFYKETAPGAIALLAPGGLLAPLLHEAKTLGAEDSTGSLRVAMKIVIALWRATQSESEETNETPKLTCPNCEAGPSELVIRSVKDTNGVKVRGLAEMECKACGFKHQFPLPDQSLDLSQNNPEEDPEQERPEVEDLFQDDIDGSDGFGLDDRERARERGVPSKSRDNKGRPSNDSESEGSESEGSESESEPSSGGKKNADSEEVDERDGFDTDESEDGETDRGRDEESRKDLEVPFTNLATGSIPNSTGTDERLSGGGAEMVSIFEGALEGWEMSGEEFLAALTGRTGAGGFFDLGQDPDSLLERVEQVLSGTELDGLINNMTGLETGVAFETAWEARDLEKGEMVWNPYNPMVDEARIVRSNHQDQDQRRANEMLARVRDTVVFLRARLRNIVRAQQMTATTHGVRRGRKLSNRRLTDTAVELLARENPSRPYQITDTAIETSLAQCIVLDQSGSMAGMVYQVAQTMMILADCAESINAKTMALGFRDGADSGYKGLWDDAYHRIQGVRYDVFKLWDEKFQGVKWRFAHTQATGSTPMADGIQYGLSALNERREAHRILWVITDGDPNSPHEKVIRRQIRLAREGGVHVIGVGIGKEAKYVTKLFPDHVWVAQVRDLPQPIVAKLNELCDFTGRYRGRKVKLDGSAPHKIR